MESGKTIQIFLPDGNPRSIKLAEFTTRTVKAILIPREKLEYAFQRQELKNNALYLLIGDSVEGVRPLLYVGETEDCITRIKDHNKKKEFWTSAIVLISSNNQFTKAHIKFLEWHCWNNAKNVGRYSLENTNNLTKPQIPEPLEAELYDNYDTIKILVSTLGYPIFDPITKSNKKNTMYCKGKDAFAEGEYTEEGFVVFAKSKTNIELAKGSGEWVKNLQTKLIADGILVKENGVCVFKSDYIFSSPSAASAIVLARSSNGWTDWKNKEGKTLDELYRK